MALKYIKPAQAAVELGISLSTVYRSVRKGVLTVQREARRIMVGVDDSQESAPQVPPSAQPPSAPPPPTSAPPPSGGQRELVVRPREGARMAFFQVPTWL
jgi:hypothetical protein